MIFSESVGSGTSLSAEKPVAKAIGFFVEYIALYRYPDISAMLLDLAGLYTSKHYIGGRKRLELMEENRSTN